MDPQLQTLGVQLAEAVVRNTAGTVFDRVGAAKAKKKDAETIAELEEILNSLISDKAELVRIAQAYEQELVAQRISPSDIEYITSNVVPVLTKLMESVGGGPGQDGTAQEMIDIVKPILSVETVTVLQLIGFNFRKAIGEPLTELVGHLILAQSKTESALALELQRLVVQRELAYIDLAKDPEAHARLLGMAGQQ